jgi:hypothetical protein
LSAQLTQTETAFLNDLEQTKRSWVVAVESALASKLSSQWSERPDDWAKLAARLDNPEDKAAMVAVVEELLSGLTHSFLATLDGATALAESTQLDVRGTDGQFFRRYLHEYWPPHRETEA